MSKLFNRILCPIAFEHESLSALDLAIAIAQQNDATLVLLNVAPLPIGAGEFAPTLDPYPAIEQVARERLERLAHDRLEGKVAYNTHVVAGDPATQILRAIEAFAADLVVMGTHGRKGVKHLLLGSVAEKVVRESPRPVLTVRPAEEAR
jgi:nucleotide-binding universal stress UspA family protein